MRQELAPDTPNTPNVAKLRINSRIPKIIGNLGPKVGGQARWLLFHGENLDRCPQELYKRAREYLIFTDETLAPIANNNENVLAILISDIFCAAESNCCKFAEEDALLYKDISHLNEHRSLLLPGLDR